MWTIFKVSIKFVTILFLFYVLVFWSWGIWDLSSPTRDWTHSRTPCIEKWSLSHWTTREAPLHPFQCLDSHLSLGWKNKSRNYRLLALCLFPSDKCFFPPPPSGFTLLSHFQSPQRSSETFPQTVSLFLCGTQPHCISQPSLQLAVAMWMKSWPMEGGQNWYVTSRLIKSHLHTALFSSSIRVLWMVWGPRRWWGPGQMSRFLKDGAEMHELLPARCTLKCRQCITNVHSVKPLNFGDC